MNSSFFEFTFSKILLSDSFRGLSIKVIRNLESFLLFSFKYGLFKYVDSRFSFFNTKTGTFKLNFAFINECILVCVSIEVSSFVFKMRLPLCIYVLTSLK